MIISTIVPVFLIIFIGWFAAKIKLCSPNLSKPLVEFIFCIALPAAIILALAQEHFSELFVWKFWLAYLVMIIIVSTITFIILWQSLKVDKIEAIIAGLASSVKNTMLIGYPILYSLIGHQAIIPMAITVIVFNCILSPFIIILFELKNQRHNTHTLDKNIKLIFKNLTKNPMIIAVIIGLLISASGIKIPFVISKTLNYFSAVVIPCALFAIGLGLKGFKLKGNNKIVISTISVNLLICPIIAIILCYVLNLSEVYSVAFVVFSSLPTAKSFYIYAEKYQVMQSECSAIISLTTLLSIITIPIAIMITHYLWPMVFTLN